MVLAYCYEHPEEMRHYRGDTAAARVEFGPASSSPQQPSTLWMSDPRVLTAEPVPGPCIAALGCLGYDVRRSKDVLPDVGDDYQLLASVVDSGHVVIEIQAHISVFRRRSSDTLLRSPP